MKAKAATFFGAVSLLAPVFCFVVDSRAPVQEDGFGVDHYALPHFMLIHVTVLLLGATAGAYAGMERSWLWYFATGANIVVLVFYMLLQNSF